VRLLLWLMLLVVPSSVWAQTDREKARYAGSESCQRCHAQIYEAWKKTRMANVVRDPKAHPEAVVADFTHADPLVTFDLKDVAFVYGSKWKQRFFTKKGDDYFVQPAQWDVAKKRWLPYHVEH
jgi:Cytochrome c554 and c-prime